MTDLFAVMAEPRRPWLNPEALKTRFLRLSADLHPDRTHGGSSADEKEAQGRFTELNTAYRCLQDPHQRLRHLLELETGASPSPVNEVPLSLVDAFMEIGGVCGEADALIAKRESTASPLLQVEIFSQAQHSIERLTKVQREIASRRDGLLLRLEALDARWIENQRLALRQPPNLVSELMEVYRLLGYLQRWSSQIQERSVQLSFG